MVAGHAHGHAHGHRDDRGGGHERRPHDHRRGPGHTTHGHSSTNERRVFWAAVLTGTFVAVELVGGILSGSLALIADAGHMFADAGALILAWFAFRMARRPADHQRTYGFDRMEVLVAFGNGLALIAIAGLITYEAVHRLFAPVEIMSTAMLVVAVAGLLVNAACFLILHGADRDNLNIRGAVLHVTGDLLGSVAAISAALIIMTTGWTSADPLLSVLVALLILRSAIRIVRDSAHILLEGTPDAVSIGEIQADLPRAVAGIRSVHHVHAWSISQARPMVTLHACVSDDVDSDAATVQVKRRLRDRFGIEHATVEVEHGACSDELVAGARVSRC